MDRWEPWTREAACVGRDPEVWFCDDRAVQQVAVRVCREECLVTRECLRYAMQNSIWYGVWGGLLPEARKKVRRLPS